MQTLSTRLFENVNTKHGILRKEIIQIFIPRFAKNADVVYIGDNKNNTLFSKDIILKQLFFSNLFDTDLPDLIAYDENKNWLYLIETIYSSGPMSEIRMLELKKALSKCTAELIFITAFISKNDFKKYFSEIGWESEVWTADNPDHMVHFNGDKFLGPHK